MTCRHPDRTVTRRRFLRTTGAASLGTVLSAALPACARASKRNVLRPNILWVTCEDMSPNLGCWGDAYARTPNIDRLAAESVRYTGAFATAPVCSPTRSCLITGVYASSLGTMHLRSRLPIPPEMKGFPSYLRAAGYYCTNNVKTDYNTAGEPAIIRASWDESSNKAHWRGRGAQQPFFSVFNDTVTHQSRSMVWSYREFQQKVQSHLTPEQRHDPAKAPVPPYYPDTPVTRRTVARYYDCITAMDTSVGRILKELQDDGLADDTIVFFYSDHGAGLPRHKRLVLDSGLHVPLLIRFPKTYRRLAPAAPGETVDRLVSFVDFAPTVLSLAGLPIPEYMQGVAFLGPAAGEPRACVYGHRDRVDEAHDLARSVRSKRYLYIRNYMPHLSYNQPSAYSDQGEIRGEITRLAAEGALKGPQLAYAGPTRPREELYDVAKDPQQLHNLADSPEHKAALQEMRRLHAGWMADSRDVAFLPEVELWRRSEGTTPYQMARETDRYPQKRILEAADLVGRGPDALPRQVELLAGADAACRYWAAVGLQALAAGAAGAADALAKALADPAPNVRIEAAGALVAMGRTEKAMPLLVKELAAEDANIALHAARTLQLLGEKARPALDALRAAATDARKRKGPLAMYIRFSTDAALKKFGR